MQTPHPILTQLQELDQLRSPPAVALKIVEVSRDPDKGLRDLADVLELDPAITAKVLQISNSAAYARAREVSTLTDAINLLGSSNVSIIALGFALKKAIPAIDHADLNDTVLWKHSVATGVASRSLSRFLGTGDDEMAFMCGMMSRIGQLLFLALLPDQYQPALSAARHLLPSAAEEQAALGITHHQVGRLLLENWQLPSTICEVVEHWGDVQPNEDLSQDAQRLVDIVKVGDTIRGLLFDDEKAACLQSMHTTSDELCGMTSGEIDRLFISCQTELQETLAVFTDTSHTDIACESILVAATEQLVQASLNLATELTMAKEDCERLRESNQELECKSATDSLTRLPNRAALDQELSALDDVSGSRKPKRAYSIMMVDVDHFKNFNDTYGHVVGDHVLQAVGKSLAESARSTDFVARYGGEEFTVILPNCDHTTAVAVADRFRVGIKRQGIELEDKTVFVTVSVGVASSDVFPVGTSHHEVLKCADTALYGAKKQGRDCVVQHETAQHAEH